MAESQNQTFQGFDFAHDPTWRIFRIMSEFVEGFTFLAEIERSVTFFGSARMQPQDHYYQLAYRAARLLSEKGYTIVTGGGPGIMEAANKGAYDNGGNSVGLNIQLPHEQRQNRYVKHGKSFSYFFSRKVMLDFSAEAYIFFPGGYGTMDEFFELVTLIQTGKVEHNVPLILCGVDYWNPLIQWMRYEMLEDLATISEKDLEIWTLTDDINEVARIVEQGVTAQTAQRMANTGRRSHTADDKLKQATKPMAGTEQ